MAPQVIVTADHSHTLSINGGQGPTGGSLRGNDIMGKAMDKGRRERGIPISIHIFRAPAGVLYLYKRYIAALKPICKLYRSLLSYMVLYVL